MPCLLVVEDDLGTAALLAKQLELCGCSRDRYAIVADAESARSALLGRQFFQYSPEKHQFRRAWGTVFHAVIWDNTFPKKIGDRPLADMGLQTIYEVASQVKEPVRSHFVMHSSDAADHFSEAKQQGKISEIWPKAIPIRLLREHLQAWGISTQS